MSRFNLIDEKWIPVRFSDGSRGELGVQDTLIHAKEIAAIENQSPLVVAALHRFLLAVLYRALKGPTDIDQAKKLFRDGLPSEKIRAYLKEWRDRFWLFDDKYPFGQNPYVSKDEIEPWTKLTVEFNATSNKVLFDHTDTNRPGSREPKECARWLITTMGFSIAGGRGYYPSPSPNAMLCIPLGSTFHDTLCYALTPYPNREVQIADSSLWERNPEPLPLARSKRTSMGYADLYSWQPRLILLEELPSGNVASVRFVAGLGFDNPSRQPDPMQPYRVDKEHGKLPVQFRADRGTWRDFDSLLPDEAGLAPQTIQHALRLAGQNQAAFPKTVFVLGLRYTPPNANVDFWRMEQFILPVTIGTNKTIRHDIRALLVWAEESQKALWIASKNFARDVLSRGDRPPDKKDIQSIVQQMPIHTWYWSVLESRFHKMLREYKLNREPDEILYQWLKIVRDTLAQSWEQHRASVSMGDAWTIRALVKAERIVRAKIRELDDEIRKYATAGEEA
jgi:CRISPR system Cascade subunit CasA